MAKEWILNQANMRWGLTKKTKVGAVSEAIRLCSPKKLTDWETYYYNNIYPKEQLVNLGRILYIKISEVCQAEIESLEEQDCGDAKKIFNIDVIDEIKSEIDRLKRNMKRFEICEILCRNYPSGRERP
ncbi:MAG: MjaI family restriction endonuclease [Deltaproteobacteria bacterium]|nr:MjaI family restriction endonuclease [Deltaproteobacteria bacterium]